MKLFRYYSKIYKGFKPPILEENNIAHHVAPVKGILKDSDENKDPNFSDSLVLTKLKSNLLVF